MDWTVRGRYGHWSQPSRPKATPAKATAAKVAAKATAAKATAATAKAAMPPEPPPAKATAATAKAAMEPPEPPPAPSPKQVAGKAAMEPPPEPSPKRVAGKAGGKKRAGGGSNRGPAQDARERQRFRDEHEKNVRLVEQVRQLEFALQQSQGSEWSAEITAELLQGQADKPASGGPAKAAAGRGERKMSPQRQRHPFWKGDEPHGRGRQLAEEVVGEGQDQGRHGPTAQGGAQTTTKGEPGGNQEGARPHRGTEKGLRVLQGPHDEGAAA